MYLRGWVELKSVTMPKKLYCTYCTLEIDESDIEEWVGKKDPIKDALCPNCHIDALVEAEGLSPIDRELLRQQRFGLEHREPKPFDDSEITDEDCKMVWYDMRIYDD